MAPPARRRSIIDSGSVCVCRLCACVELNDARHCRKVLGPLIELDTKDSESAMTLTRKVFKSHFKVTKVKITRSGQTVARRP